LNGFTREKAQQPGIKILDELNFWDWLPAKKLIEWNRMKPLSATSAFQLLAVIFLALVSTATAGPVAAPYAIGTWEGFRPAAITYTFDDNLPNQYAIAVPMFHAAGLKMTLFTVVDSWVPTFTWAQAQNAASLGDEIGSHTMTHPDLTTVPATQLTNELANSQSNIEVQITNELCVTLAYPDCTVPSESLTAQYYIAARICSGSLVPATPSDFYQISSYVLGNTGSYTTGASINALADSAVSQQRWCVYLIHALDGDNGYSPLPSAALQASVYYTSTNQSKFWVETFGNVVRYIKERNASAVTETANTGSSITVQVTNNLNNTIYNYPITLRRPMPSGWLAAAVTQNGQPITANLVTISSTNYVMFDIVPNGGNVILSQVNSQGNNLQVTVPASSFGFPGLLVGQGSLTASPAPTNDLVVTLTSGNTNKVTVPSSVVISAGQTNAVFGLTIINDMLLDGNQSVAITATALNYGTSQATILVSNINSASLTVTLPTSAVKGAGTLTNAGLVSASSVVAANYTVSLVSSDTRLTVPATVVILAGQSSVLFSPTILSNTLVDGPQTVTVTAHVSGWTDGSSSMTIFDDSLQVTVPATAMEGAGLLAGQGSIIANPAPTNGLVVTLTSGNTSKVTVPSSVVISAGQTNAVFDLTIINNSLLDGNQTAAITATAPNYGTSQATILVSNINTATLTVTLPASAVKGAGTLINAGLVTASSVVTSNYTVSLVSSDTSKLTVPSSVVIPAGQSSVSFNLTILGDTLIDGPQTVTVTAHVPVWTDGSSSMTILDNNPPPDHFVWNVVPSPQFSGQPFPVTITSQDINNATVNYMLPVNISAWAPGTASATNTVLGPPVEPDSTTDGFEYVLGYSFTPGTNLVVTAFRYYFGDNVSLWTDSGVLLASQNVTSVPGTWLETPLTNPVVLLAGVTYRIGVHENGVTYYFDDVLQTSFPNGVINAYWYSYGDVFPNAPDTVMYYVDLRYSTDVRSVPVNPVVSGNFTNGVWAGNLAALQPAASLTIQSSIPGHSGQSLPFDVLSAPRLSIAASGGSVVASWPVVPAGFSLEETPVLSAGAVWTGVPGSSIVGGLNVVTNTPAGATMFYRLQKH
jgi:oligosaccharide reducing-end xylanase